jgi:DNA-binding Lrp family transcriptional regulator
MKSKPKKSSNNVPASSVFESLNRYCRVPGNVFRSAEISGNALKVYCYLSLMARYGSRVMAAQDTIATYLGMHRVTVLRAMEELEKAGFIRRKGTQTGVKCHLLTSPIFRLPGATMKGGKVLESPSPNGAPGRPQLLSTWISDDSADVLRLLCRGLKASVEIVIQDALEHYLEVKQDDLQDAYIKSDDEEKSTDENAAAN